MQESVPDNELSQLRKLAAHKGLNALCTLGQSSELQADNRYATLENELLKKNNELLATKGTLDETLYKVSGANSLHTTILTLL